MDFKAGECITVVGKRGCGKSWRARKIIKSFKRVVIFDPVNDWSDGTVVSSFDSFAEKIKLFKNVKTFTIVFRFSPDDENRAEILNEALRVIYHVGNIQVVIDEVQLFSSPHFMPRYLENLYFIGRHKDIGVLAITQRPSRLNKSCLSQSEHVFVGQLHEKNDISVVADFIGESVESIVDLKPREFFYFSPTYGKKRIK